MSKRGPDASYFAVPDADIMTLVAETITPIVSIPEAERLNYYRSLQRCARADMNVHSLYYMRKLVGICLQLAQATWPVWPPQDARDDRSGPVPGHSQRDPEPVGGGTVPVVGSVRCV